MTAHPMERLPLEAAGALEQAETELVAAHLGQCSACRGEAAGWRVLAEELRRLPPPRPGRDLVWRTRQAVVARLAERADRAWLHAALGFLVAFAWTFALVAWFALELVTGQLAAWLARPVGATVWWYAAYLVAGWLCGAAVAVLLGRSSRREGRLA